MSPNELSELAPIAKTLNQESDDINKTIVSLNEEIASLNLGIEVWFGADEDPEYQIGFAQVSEGSTEKWQLAFRSTRSNEDRQPLLKASRNLRIEGLRKTGMILFSLRQEAMAKILAIQEAKNLISELSAEREEGKGRQL
jgi:hypothetical protein